MCSEIALSSHCRESTSDRPLNPNRHIRLLHESTAVDDLYRTNFKIQISTEDTNALLHTRVTSLAATSNIVGQLREGTTPRSLTAAVHSPLHHSSLAMSTPAITHDQQPTLTQAQYQQMYAMQQMLLQHQQAAQAAASASSTSPIAGSDAAAQAIYQPATQAYEKSLKQRVEDEESAHTCTHARASW